MEEREAAERTNSCHSGRRDDVAASQRNIWRMSKPLQLAPPRAALAGAAMLECPRRMQRILPPSRGALFPTWRSA
jgi:hypothetical protein